MKKRVLAVAVLAIAASIAACSSGKKTQDTTSAAQESSVDSSESGESSADSETLAVEESQSGESQAQESTEEEPEEDYYSGTVTAINGKVITLKGEDGTEAKFDITNTQFSDDTQLGVGDEIDVTFYGTLSKDTTKAEFIDIVVSAAELAKEAAAEEEDPVVTGTIEKVDGSILTLNTDEGLFSFDTSIAQKVTKGGIVAGVEAEVTYYGDPEDAEDRAMATRIVTEDAMDSEDANMYTLTGTVVEASSESVILETADKDKSVFNFIGEAGMFDGLNKGDTATVIYEGTLTAKTIQATGLE